MSDQAESSAAAQRAPSPSAYPLRPRWFYARGGDWVVFSESDDELLESQFQKVGGQEWSLRAKKERGEQEAKESQGQQDHKGGEKAEARRREERERQQVRKEAALAGVDFKNNGWLGTFSSWTGSWNSSSKDKDTEDDSKRRKDNDKKPNDDEPKMVEEILDPDETEEDRKYKVSVLEDKLFDVDLEKMHLYPAFFKGVLLPVVRATWFYWSEVREEYSPISWDSDLGQDLSSAWERSEAWKLPRLSAKDKDESQPEKAPFIEIRTGEHDNSEEDDKAKVQFKSPISASIFSEDIRGRVVSLVGGFTVIRGFAEIEKRTTKPQKGRAFFDLPDVPFPWSKTNDEQSANDEAANQAQLNNAAKRTKKAGAAQPDSKARAPPSGGGGYGSSEKQASSGGGGGDAAAEDNQGFAASLWPSSDSWLRPRFAFLKALGFNSDDATEEAKRTQKQKNTEEAAEPESEHKSGASGDRANPAGIGGGPTDTAEDLESRKDDPVHLILVIHGIGQGLRDTFESLDFTWDVQKIRNLSRTTSQDEGIKRLSKGRRVQYIPICWRRDLDFSYQSEENDNQFGLADVTNDATIPFVRNVVSKVILDVPYYLSDIHKPKMIKAVTQELNRVYRLFVRRNPDFLEKGGKVSIIGHSLGSCLATDILSSQPTSVPPITQLSHEEIQDALTKRLLFDTTHLFLVGSPLGLFLHLGGGQLIARRTDSRAQIGDTCSVDKQGKFGCMAFSGNIYNCYNAADPVAYRLNGTVDQRYANLISPIPLPGAVNAILDHLKQPRLIISKLFDPVHPFSSFETIKEVAKKVSLERLPVEADDEQTSSKDVKQAEISAHQNKIKTEQEELKRYAETHDGAVDSFASRAARKANQIANEKKRQEGDDSAEAIDVPGAGALSPVRLEEGEAAKQSLPARLVLAHAHAREKDQQKKGDGEATLPANSSSSPRLKSLFAHLTKAEQRFRALNRHGCVDFFFEDTGSLSEYFSMLGAHNGYWESVSFVSLILSQVFDDNEDDGPHAANLVPNVAKPSGDAWRQWRRRASSGHSQEDGEDVDDDTSSDDSSDDNEDDSDDSS